MTKKLLSRFKKCLGPFNMLTVHKCSDTELFRHLSNPAFCNLKFQKQITCEDHLLSKSIRKKIRKYFFDFKIIAFELVPLDACFY